MSVGRKMIAGRMTAETEVAPIGGMGTWKVADGRNAETEVA